ncbi:DUF6922 domain-containing protein [Flavobacterium agrisoli]
MEICSSLPLIVSNSIILKVKRSINIATIFPKHLFWDMDYDKLSLSRDKDIIIPRALYATTPDTFEEDIKKLENLYSSKTIVKYLKQTTEKISNKVCLLVAKRYNVEPFVRFSL